MTDSGTANSGVVLAYLRELQDRICAQLEAADGAATFRQDPWNRSEGGGGESRVLRNGRLFEQAGVNFSHVMGSKIGRASCRERVSCCV